MVESIFPSAIISEANLSVSDVRSDAQAPQVSDPAGRYADGMKLLLLSLVTSSSSFFFSSSKRARSSESVSIRSRLQKQMKILIKNKSLKSSVLNFF